MHNSTLARHIPKHNECEWKHTSHIYVSLLYQCLNLSSDLKLSFGFQIPNAENLSIVFCSMHMYTVFEYHITECIRMTPSSEL